MEYEEIAREVNNLSDADKIRLHEATKPIDALGENFPAPESVVNQGRVLLGEFRLDAKVGNEENLPYTAEIRVNNQAATFTYHPDLSPETFIMLCKEQAGVCARNYLELVERLDREEPYDRQAEGDAIRAGTLKVSNPHFDPNSLAAHANKPH